MSGLILPKNLYGVLSKHEEQSDYLRAIFLLKNIIHDRDRYTYIHSVNVSKYASSIGNEIGLNEKEVADLSVAAILHDIGKSKVPLRILMKKGKLSFNEFEIIKQHVLYGTAVISEYKKFSHLNDIILSHHERIDGNGYPNKLKGENIPFMSRIISIADSFDAMTTDRPYKKAISLKGAIQELDKNAGTQFDEYLVKEFIKFLRRDVIAELWV